MYHNILNEAVDGLENGDLIFIRYAEDYKNHEHVVIYWKEEDSTYDIVHNVLLGLIHSSLKEYIEVPTRTDYLYSIVRFSPEYRNQIIEQVRYFFGKDNTSSQIGAAGNTYDRSNLLDYNYLRLCAYNILSKLKQVVDGTYQTQSKVESMRYKEVQQQVKERGISSTTLDATCKIKTALTSSSNIPFFQYCKYASRQKMPSPNQPLSNMTCSQFVLLCLVIPRIQQYLPAGNFSLKRLDEYQQSISEAAPEKFTFKMSLSDTKMQNAVICAYNGYPLTREYVPVTPTNSKPERQPFPELDAETKQNIKDALGSFVELNPHTVISGELYALLHRGYEHEFVEYRPINKSELNHLLETMQTKTPGKHL
ncbi:MAG: hypothetical protein AB7F64_02165 [Gammaproteobacteria bacterium]